MEFFKKRGHAIIPSASLVPEGDASVLFTTAGMQPLAPYLLGAKHPSGVRLANAQKCVRTQDIDEVGDNTHDTFFEMLGNWSLGDYFKAEAIAWSYEFLTSKDEGLGLDPKRLYITVFEGDENAPRDTEAYEIWKTYMPENHIYFMSAKSNWWSPGDNGPCGPDTEMFYDVTERGLGDMTLEEYKIADSKQEVVEIWNDVFMEYEKKDGKVIGKLQWKNVDTGAGLERLAMMMQKKSNVFDTDLFAPIMMRIRELAGGKADDIRAMRIVADHVRTSVFMVGDGVLPSNTDRGYILRRLIRRAVRYADTLGMAPDTLADIVPVVLEIYDGVYDNLAIAREHIILEIKKEEGKFRATLGKAIKEFDRVSASGHISGSDMLMLFSTFGLPAELTEELARERNVTVDMDGFKEELEKHRALSRAGAEKKFKGGLADTSEMSVRYHTATHLLHQALRVVLGTHVEQKGSNITPERMRFDFSHPAKLTDEEKKQVEDLVNAKIMEALPVIYTDMTQDEARTAGAIGLFAGSYGEKVRVYQVGEGAERFSMEFCGGPHVQNTRELGQFKIEKEEAVSAGVRRIKAVLI